MLRKVRINGVTYVNEKGRRFPIPAQTCELEEDAVKYGSTVKLLWKSENGQRWETMLTEREHARYRSINAIEDV